MAVGTLPSDPEEMSMHPFLPVLAALGLSLPVMSQGTGRVMRLLAPVVIGQTASFGMTHPVAAAGNLYVFLWCSPPFAGTATLTVPGFSLLGPIFVDPSTVVPTASGLLGASGSVTHALTIPNDSSFVGYAWDLQSVDLEVSTSTLQFAVNELSLVVADAPPPGMNMVAIPAGTFLMGSPVTPFGVSPYFNMSNTQPVHQVTISRPFWICKYEVTQGEYQALMGTNPSYSQPPHTPTYDPQRPVESLGWVEARAYCTALTAQQSALGRVPSGYQYRLPTEAEWEYCCRAGTTTEYYFGSTLDCGQANFGFNQHTSSSCSSPSGVGTAVVGSYAPNAWGLYDMHGNVYEWCLDEYDDSVLYPASSVVDPYVRNIGPFRVYRGGGWTTYSSACRSAFRYGDYQTYTWYNRGFRVVLAPVLP